MSEEIETAEVELVDLNIKMKMDKATFLNAQAFKEALANVTPLYFSTYTFHSVEAYEKAKPYLPENHNISSKTEETLTVVDGVAVTESHQTIEVTVNTNSGE